VKKGQGLWNFNGLPHEKRCKQHRTNTLLMTFDDAPNGVEPLLVWISDQDFKTAIVVTRQDLDEMDKLNLADEKTK
jgi:hypothetical protein